MAFTLLNFQFARGVDFAYAQGTGVTSIMHTYISTTDTVATIITPGYFHNGIDGTKDKVFVGDTILIIGSDQIALVKVLSTAPVLLSTNAFLPAGSVTTFSTQFNDENNLHVTPAINFTVTKTNNIVTMVVQGVIDIGTLSATPARFFTSLTPLPPSLTPAFLGDGYFKIVQSGVISLGEIEVTPLGSITIYASPIHTATFTVSVPTSFGAGSINYITA